MIHHWKKIRNIILTFFLCVLLSNIISISFAKTSKEMVDKAQSTEISNKVKTVGVKSFLNGFTNIFTDMNEYFANKDREKAKEEKKKEKEAKNKDKKLIDVKKIENVNKEPAKKKKAPYKVYSAPIIEDDNYFEYDKKTKMPPPKYKSVSPPSLSSFPKQFFPILPIGSGFKKEAQLLPFVSNKMLGSDLSNINRAIIVIHDISRNASQSLATLTTLSGSNSNNVLIISPQFPIEVDIMRFAKYLPDSGRQVARWNLNLGWQFGGVSKLSKRSVGISSFTAIDILMMFLTDKKRFPSLEKIIMVGHGYGADFLQRYSSVGVAPSIVKKENVDLKFVIANPSSYLYPTATRKVKSSKIFNYPNKKECPNVNDYPYGVNNLSSYARRRGASSIRLDYPLQSITYLIGNKIIVDNYLDRNCAAMMQGKTRLNRAINFSRYLIRSFGEKIKSKQIFVTVPNASYDPISLYGSYCGMKNIFGNGDCRN